MRRKSILVTPEAINMTYGVLDYRDDKEQLIVEKNRVITMELVARILGF